MAPLRRKQDESDLIFLIEEFHRKRERPGKIKIGIISIMIGIAFLVLSADA